MGMSAMKFKHKLKKMFQELSNSRRQLIGIDDLKANYAARALHIAAAQCKSVRAAKRI
jgi:hypothetical protein